MSIASRLRNPKRPTANARREIKAQAVNDGNTVVTCTPYRRNDGSVSWTTNDQPAAFNLTQGHRDLGLIQKPRRGGYRLFPQRPATFGAFGGIRKDGRKARDDARKASFVAEATKPLFR